MKKLGLFMFILMLYPFCGWCQLKFEETLSLPYNSYLYSQDANAGNSELIATGYCSTMIRGNNNIILVKWNSTPGYDWIKKYYGPTANSDIGRFVISTKDSGYLVTGLTNSYSSGANYNGFALKLDNSGNVSWFKYWGGSYEDIAYSACEDSSYFYVTGKYGISSTSSSSNGFICCFNKSNGNLVWGKRYKNYNNQFYQKFTSIIIGYDGNLIVTGTASNASATQILCANINRTNGNVIWSYRYYTNSVSLTSSNIVKGHNNCYIITGIYNYSTKYRVLLLKLKSNGTVHWAKNYSRSGTDDDGIQTVKTSDGYTVFGVTKSFGSNDIFLMNTDTTGSDRWLKYYHGPSTNEGNTSFRDVGAPLCYMGEDGYAIASGQIKSSGYMNAYLLRTDLYGQTGCELDSSFLDSTMTVYRASLNDSIFQFSVTDSMISKLTISPVWDTICGPDSLNSSRKNFVGIINQVAEEAIMVYPNPAKGTITVEFSDFNSGDAAINLFDFTGQRVIEKTIDPNSTSVVPVNIGNLSSGVYILTIRQKDKLYSKKLIIE